MLKIVLGVLIGGAVGALIGYKGRCSTGACPLTSSPYVGGMFGAVLGLMIAGLLISPESGGSLLAGGAESGFLHAASAEEFDQMIAESEGPVLVDFWATWCPPCKAQGKILDEMAGEFEGKVRVVKVDVDEAGELAARHGIRSIPTLLVIEGGEVQERVVGVQSPEELRSLLKLGDT